MGTLLLIWASVQVKALVYALAANVVIAIAVSIRTGDFRLVKAGEWLQRLVIFLLGYTAAALIALASPDLLWLQTAAFAFLMATLIGYVLINLKELGFPVPDALGGKPTS